MTPDNVNLEYLQRQNDALRGQVEQARTRISVGGGGGDSHIPSMDERIGKLETAIEWLKHSQLLVAAFAAVIIGLGIYELQRIDRVDDKVSALSDRINALPGQISSDLRDLTKTLADSINAAKQQPPQVILMPAPAPPQQVPAPKP